MDLETMILAAPLLLSVVTVLIVLVVDMISRRVAVALGALGLLTAAGFAAYGVYGVEEVISIENVLVGGGGYSAPAVLVCALGALALIGGWHWYTESPRGGAAAALVVMVAAGSTALSAAVDMLFILIVLEILAVCGYALVTQAGTARSAEAGVKYVIQGSVATGLLVLALSVLLGLHGSVTSIVLIAENLTREFAAQTMLVVGLLAAAYSYKLGAFPFHSWAPDAFETAPPASSAALASLPKIAAMTSLFIVFFRGFGLTFSTVSIEGYIEIAGVLGAVAAASIVFGNLAALRQSSYTRMLGYSGIAQVGYALVGPAVVVGEAGRDAGGSNLLLVLPSTAILISAYAVAVLGAFMIAEAVSRKRPDWDRSVAGLAGMGRESVPLGISAVVIMLSMTGIPLTAGFWGKLYVFGAAVEVDWVWLAVVGVLGSVISFGYYGNVLKVMFFDDAPSAETNSHGRARAPIAVTILVAGILLFFGIMPLLTGVAPLFRFFAY